jgi:hypothetical protein
VRSLSILHAPAHAPSLNLAALRFACGQGADSIGFTEAYAMTRALRRRVGYRCRVGKSPVDTRGVVSPRGDAGDVPILVRRSNPIAWWHAERVHGPGEPAKFAPERWLTQVAYEARVGGVDHIAAHPSPRFVDDGRAWDEYMVRLCQVVDRARERGRFVVLTGDMQAAHSVDEALRDHGLIVWRVGIDVIATSPGLRRVEASRLVDPSQVRQAHPHPWLLARYALDE